MMRMFHSGDTSSRNASVTMPATLTGLKSQSSSDSLVGEMGRIASGVPCARTSMFRASTTNNGSKGAFLRWVATMRTMSPGVHFSSHDTITQTAPELSRRTNVWASAAEIRPSSRKNSLCSTLLSRILDASETDTTSFVSTWGGISCTSDDGSIAARTICDRKRICCIVSYSAALSNTHPTTHLGSSSTSLLPAVPVILV